MAWAEKERIVAAKPGAIASEVARAAAAHTSQLIPPGGRAARRPERASTPTAFNAVRDRGEPSIPGRSAGVAGAGWGYPRSQSCGSAARCRDHGRPVAGIDGQDPPCSSVCARQLQRPSSGSSSAGAGEPAIYDANLRPPSSTTSIRRPGSPICWRGEADRRFAAVAMCGSRRQAA